MATEPIASETRYSLEDALARFDTLIDQLSSATDDAVTDEVDELQADATEPVIEERAPVTRPAKRPTGELVLQVSGLVKSFGDTVAVDRIDLDVRPGTIFGIVGPNGAGKTTTLSMVTGLLRPDAGEIKLAGADVWADASRAKREMGILPDRLILFDRLTGRQLLHYAGLLHGMDTKTVKARTADLVSTIGLDEAQHRLVTDYSAGMTKKVALAAAMIHAPRLLVLDEPFESVDTVSAERIIDILNRYVAAGGTVILSSHSMDLIERICDAVAVIVDGRILATGTVADVRGDQSLEERFVDLVKTNNAGEDLEWLRSFSD
ncbi:ABC transporter ATP-binding protein [Homoserinimonas sp. A447]